MSVKDAKKVPLAKINHSVRAAQAVLQYGVGNYVDFPDQTLMTAAPEYWETQVKRVTDQRLAKALHVEYFGMPAAYDRDGKDLSYGISYARFPEWYFCPKCRKFQPITEWAKEFRSVSGKISESDPDMVRNIRCPNCRQNLIVTRIVTACRNGHIDDFPWVKWVHCQNVNGRKKICGHPRIYIKTGTTSSEGLESIGLICENCHATTTLRNAFTPGFLEELDKKTNGEYDFTCTGRHPWKNSQESCGEYPVVLQRGSSSVYFPVTVSSLVIPPYSSLLLSKIETSNGYDECRKAIIESLKTLKSALKMTGVPLTDELQNNVKNEKIEAAAAKIAIEIGVKADQIREILKKKWFSEESDDIGAGSIQYREEEYEALTGRVRMDSDEYGSDFVREEAVIENYNLPYIRQISLIHKIREVRALIGYSRLKPYEEAEKTEKQSRFVNIKENETDWYPAYEVRGEGIFIEFDNKAIQKWIEKNPETVNRAEQLAENYRNSFSGSRRSRNITPKFVLLHTIAHLLIKQLSFECGYSIASIRERLFCSEKTEGSGMEMAGILIYTASGDSEGTLGGLVRQGCADTFPGIFKKAVESALACSNDPVCSLSNGQGRDSLNLAACYSCTLIPETSCEEFNSFLDRGMLVGTIENRKYGFFTDLINHSWRSSQNSVPESEEQNEKKTDLKSLGITVNLKAGSDLTDTDYTDIWDDLLQWAEDDQEIKLLNSIIENIGRFTGKEKPVKNAQIIIGTTVLTCDLLWKKSKVMYFTADNMEGYEKLRGREWRCFSGTDTDIQAEDIIGTIQEI